jgi:hypothetical protein
MELLLKEKHNSAEKQEAFKEILVDPEFSDFAESEFNSEYLRFFWKAEQLLSVDANTKEMAAKGWNDRLTELLLKVAEKHNVAEQHNAFEEILVDPDFSDFA